MNNQNNSDKKSDEHEEHEEHEVASYTEIWLRNKFAPELLSSVGKTSVVFIFVIWTVIATFGVLNV